MTPQIAHNLEEAKNIIGEYRKAKIAHSDSHVRDLEDKLTMYLNEKNR